VDKVGDLEGRLRIDLRQSVTARRLKLTKIIPLTLQQVHQRDEICLDLHWF